MKVLIVDDEVVIRNGMVNVLPWKDYGYEVLSPAASGEEALLIIESDRPEIIITDIRMQGISGLELVNLMSEIDYPKEVIILTGYDEYSYVQEAIKQNVSDYLLKTSSPDEILQSVNNARDRLTKLGNYENMDKSATEKLLNNELRYLLDKFPNQSRPKQLLKQESNLQGTSFQLIVINKRVSDKTYFMSEKLWNTYLYGRWLTNEEHTIIIMNRKPDLSDFYLFEMAAKNINEIYGEPLFTSRIFTSLNELSLAYKEAVSLFFYKWLLPDRVTISVSDVRGRRGITNFDNYKEFEGELIECVRHGDMVGLDVWVNRFLTWAFSHPMATPKSIEIYIQELYENVVKYILAIGKSVSYKQEKPLINQFINDPTQTLVELFAGLLLNDKNNQTEVVKYVAEALYFMEENLDKQVTLLEVATHAKIHPNYLSEMIKKKTGKTFLDTLINLRMGKATEYLINSEKTVNEIARKVGYQEVEEFVKVFEAYYTMTPALYRDHIQKNN